MAVECGWLLEELNVMVRSHVTSEPRIAYKKDRNHDDPFMRISARLHTSGQWKFKRMNFQKGTHQDRLVNAHSHRAPICSTAH